MILKNMTLCKLCKLRQENNVVLPKGPIPSKLMIVGDKADDADELTSEPMYDSHDYLIKLLSRAGLDFNQCYITMAVKCVGSKTATDGWKCREWLAEEARVVKPRLILALGKTATSFLLNNKKLKLQDVLGQYIHVESYDVIPWHSLNVMLKSGKSIDNSTIEILKGIKDVCKAV